MGLKSVKFSFFLFFFFPFSCSGCGEQGSDWGEGGACKLPTTNMHLD